MRRLALATGPALAVLLASVPAVPAQSQTAPAPHPCALARTRLRGDSVGFHLRLRELELDQVGDRLPHPGGGSPRLLRQGRHPQDPQRRVASGRRPSGHRRRSPQGRPLLLGPRTQASRAPTSRAGRLPVRVATRAHVARPASPSSTTSRAPAPVRRRSWTSGGSYTDFYRITTALTPFGSSKTPANGRHAHTTFKVSGRTALPHPHPAQSRAAGAGLGQRAPPLLPDHRGPPGQGGLAGTALRPTSCTPTIAGHAPDDERRLAAVRRYNVHVEAKDVPGHPGATAAPDRARTSPATDPAIVGFRGARSRPCGTTRTGGIGLQAALQSDRDRATTT